MYIKISRLIIFVITGKVYYFERCEKQSSKTADGRGLQPINKAFFLTITSIALINCMLLSPYKFTNKQ